ncbi:MAG: penicillin-binding transpeptidase domain-containing protein [Archangium sp.]|nr:penicillin-binding transpeptidase domain-containing protein [Archangium sp.]
MKRISLFEQVLLTYLLPVLPLVIAWDGAMSNARTYSEDDLSVQRVLRIARSTACIDRLAGRAIRVTLCWVRVLPVPVLGLLLLLASCAPVTRVLRPRSDAERAAETFLRAWADGDIATQRSLAAPHALAEQLVWRDRLGVVASRFEIVDVDEQPGNARVTFRGVHTLRGLGDWVVMSALELEHRKERWLVRWTPAVLHANARAGDRFDRRRSFGARAPLLDRHGVPLTVQGEVVSVGVVPGRVDRAEEVAAALQSHVQLEPSVVHGALWSGGGVPDAFVPLIDLRPERYEAVRPALAPVPGIFFRRKTLRLTPTEGFAAHTLGRVGTVTTERLAELGVPYQVGDVVGLSGLERVQERTLAGLPEGEVRLRRASGESVLLHRFEGRAGKPVSTTLDRDVQVAAEAALSEVREPAALVAVKAGSGEVLAVVSRPLGVSLNRALQGLYPPGSTFKVVTAEALLARGLTPESTVSCPATAEAGGFRFRNFDGAALGETTLRRAFAESCNTAFILLGAELKQDGVAEAARRFGFDVDYDVGLPSPRATFPAPDDPAERAAATIGQGRVLATPLHMASVAAAVGAGEWRSPSLLADPVGSPARGPRLGTGTVRSLRVLMHAVVAEGTGKAAAGVPGLIGKTGSAEFGTEAPLRTHAWFIGLQGDVAFAIIVEGGGTGGKVAAPIAARFAGALATGR